MNLGEIIAIIATIIFIVIITTIFVLVDCKNIKFVLEKSERIKELINLNSSFYFEKLQSKYYNHQKCSSKRQWDNFLIDDYLIALIDSNEYFYRNIIQSIEKNISTYNRYIYQVSKIKSTVTEEFCD